MYNYHNIAKIQKCFCDIDKEKQKVQNLEEKIDSFECIKVQSFVQKARYPDVTFAVLAHGKELLPIKGFQRRRRPGRCIKLVRK